MITRKRMKRLFERVSLVPRRDYKRLKKRIRKLEKQLKKAQEAAVNGQKAQTEVVQPPAPPVGDTVPSGTFT